MLSTLFFAVVEDVVNELAKERSNKLLHSNDCVLMSETNEGLKNMYRK